MMWVEMLVVQLDDMGMEQNWKYTRYQRKSDFLQDCLNIYENKIVDLFLLISHQVKLCEGDPLDGQDNSFSLKSNIQKSSSCGEKRELGIVPKQ